MIKTLIIGGEVIFSQLLGVAFFTNQSQWGELYTNLAMMIMVV
ncbi:hypothetical protein [Photobacterium leiognathi]|nr:hypothetical protein [Photobacterium leiognathi]